MKNNYTSAIVFFLRIMLGIVFIYASYHKIADPSKFARVLYGYAIFPGIYINVLAIVFPFIELVAGFSLIFGLFPEAALLIINTLLSAFIILVGFNLLRGHQFDCGCFVFSGRNQTISLIYLMIRDLLLLASGIYVWRRTIAS